MRKSFDLFDTLIARRCISPLAILSAVEQSAKILGLAQARMNQGHRLWSEGTDHTTQDMYAAALHELGHAKSAATLAQASQLASLEYRCEHAELIPVRRHLQELQPTDWIISDMHHPDWVLHRLLGVAGAQVGIRWPSTLLRTNRGKHDGELWQRLHRTHGRFVHLGDNLHSDVTQAQAHGHSARHTQWSLPNAPEQALAAIGANSIMRAARSTRLRCTGAPGTPWADLEEVMASWVFPVLALGALLLRDAMQQLSRGTVVFCGRDGGTWLKVFAVLFPDIPVVALASSRHSLVRGKRAYADFVKMQLGPRHEQEVLLADLCGTGTSWAVFCERWQIPPTPLVFLNAYTPAPERLDGKSWAQGLVSVPMDDGGLAFEALCEESYPGLTDVTQQIGLADQARVGELHATPQAAHVITQRGFDHQWAHASAQTTNPAAQRMADVLEVALQELKLEVGRANDRMDGPAAKDLMRRLIEGLAATAPLIERVTNFSTRNRQTAGNYGL